MPAAMLALPVTRETQNWYWTAVMHIRGYCRLLCISARSESCSRFAIPVKAPSHFHLEDLQRYFAEKTTNAGRQNKFR